MTGDRPETFISVDLETAGPYPPAYSVLSIGACLLDDPAESFYVELRPESDRAQESALAVSGLSMQTLASDGVESALAWTNFVAWVNAVVPAGAVPVFVAFNAAFDWMFVSEALGRHGINNPFGHTALDIKAYHLGMAGGTWAGTSMRYLAPRYLSGRPLTHNALDDARDQADLFRAMRAEADSQRHN